MSPGSTDVDTKNGRAESDSWSRRDTQQAGRQAFWRSLLDIIATLLMMAVAGTILFNWYHTPKPPPIPVALPVPTKPVSLDGLPLLGQPGAKAGVLIFSDFQCPYCARFVAETMPRLKELYVDKGLVRVGFRHLPLVAIHSRAERAAESAECAARQGEFWAMHDALFSNPSRLDEDALTADAVAVGLNKSMFEACMSGPPSNHVKRDLEIAESLGFRGTPSFIVGRLESGALRATALFVGTRPLEEFAKALDPLVSVR